MCSHLEIWGLSEIAETAQPCASQLCVIELFANGIVHVGEHVPVTVHLSLSGARARIELGDPARQARPVLRSAAAEEEVGRPG